MARPGETGNKKTARWGRQAAMAGWQWFRLSSPRMGYAHRERSRNATPPQKPPGRGACVPAPGPHDEPSLAQFSKRAVVRVLSPSAETSVRRPTWSRSITSARHARRLCWLKSGAPAHAMRDPADPVAGCCLGAGTSDRRSLGSNAWCYEPAPVCSLACWLANDIKPKNRGRAFSTGSVNWQGSPNTRPA